jgi:hypothetical protein
MLLQGRQRRAGSLAVTLDDLGLQDTNLRGRGLEVTTSLLSVDAGPGHGCDEGHQQQRCGDQDPADGQVSVGVAI